ncbi:galactose-binding domain-like protein [Chytridium lagenaria]|nr:galactose-binding domain-like protein [Chytridium lagenaria]
MTIANDNITGLKVSMASSFDHRHPPENMVDANTKTFWITTGLFPQEFVVTLPGPSNIKKLTIWSMKVASWAVASCYSDKPNEFEEVVHQECEDAADHLQVTHIVIPGPAKSHAQALHAGSGIRHLKITLRKGHWDFASVHRITVQGEVLPHDKSSRSETHEDEDSRRKTFDS